MVAGLAQIEHHLVGRHHRDDSRRDPVCATSLQRRRGPLDALDIRDDERAGALVHRTVRRRLGTGTGSTASQSLGRRRGSAICLNTCSVDLDHLGVQVGSPGHHVPGRPPGLVSPAGTRPAPAGGRLRQGPGPSSSENLGPRPPPARSPRPPSHSPRSRSSHSARPGRHQPVAECAWRSCARSDRRGRRLGGSVDTGSAPQACAGGHLARRNPVVVPGNPSRARRESQSR